MAEFKVGDRVRLNSLPDTYKQNGANVGQLGTITHIPCPFFSYGCAVSWDGIKDVPNTREHGQRILACELKNIEKVGFGVGDKVRCISSPVGIRNDEYEGKIVTVSAVKDGRITNILEWEQKGWGYCEGWFELLEPYKIFVDEAVGFGIYKSKQSLMDTLCGTSSSIIRKIKDLVLTADDRILRKHGFEDSCGDTNGSARELMVSELVEERWKTRRADVAENLRTVEAEEKK